MQLFPLNPQGTFCQPKHLQLRIFLLFSPKALEQDIIITSKVSKIQGTRQGPKTVYRIYSIKRRPRLNAADGSKITNKRHTQSEECGVCSRIIRKKITRKVKLGNLHMNVVHITSQTIMILSQQKSETLEL